MRRALAIATIVALLPACARHYRADGLVLKVEPGRGSMLVSHRAIAGYMPAMVMPVQVARASELRDVRPGSRLTFDLRIQDGHAVARNLRAFEKTLDGAGGLVLPDAQDRVPVGGIVPDFQLLDQHGNALRFSQFRGQAVVVNFIYTRCPLPEVCPRLSASFAYMQKRFSSRMGRDLILLSITLDPRTDTPTVLADYARRWRAGAAGWKFATGPATEIEAVARRLGVIYWPEEGLITHTSSTSIVGPDGVLLACVDGSNFQPAQLGDLVAQYLLPEQGSQ